MGFEANILIRTKPSPITVEERTPLTFPHLGAIITMASVLAKQSASQLNQSLIEVSVNILACQLRCP
jgi:hypothetical protein